MKDKIWLGKLFGKKVYIDCENMTDKEKENIKKECKEFREYLRKKYK